MNINPQEFADLWFMLYIKKIYWKLGEVYAITNSNIAISVRAYKSYWEFLGTMRGINNVTGKVCRLEGDINYTYLVTLDENAYEHEIFDIVERITNKEIANEFRIIPELYSFDISDAVTKKYSLKPSYGFSMIKGLTQESYKKRERKELNLYRINTTVEVKFCGAILNTCFEYRPFSFSHYLDAFNNESIRFYIAEYNGLPVGACMAMYGMDYVEIVWIGTLKGYRKLGIAAELMRMAEQDAIKTGRELAILTCQQENKHIYEKMNYKQSCTLLSLAFQPD